MRKGNDMITTILAGIFGGIALTSSVWVYVERHKPPAQVVDVEAVVESVMEQHKPAVQLTDKDIIAVPCSSAYIEAHGQALCREMFCRMTTRGIDTKTSGGECERISNLINKTHVIDVCSQQNDFAACVDLYDKRL